MPEVQIFVGHNAGVAASKMEKWIFFCVPVSLRQTDRLAF